MVGQGFEVAIPSGALTFSFVNVLAHGPRLSCSFGASDKWNPRCGMFTKLKVRAPKLTLFETLAGRFRQHAGSVAMGGAGPVLPCA